ncbi:MAG: selenide, water dikinase SelD, partial [Gemmatimonadetes bacterium]|nr:selenide, water dikinase SelD [Gemmatimonadota bacterium]
MGPEDLRRALAFLPERPDPRVLLGPDAFADAGIIRVRDDLALVQTCDFFTPIVDDPHDFGEIAAANALSDVYAMGAEPLCALNIVCFPESGVDFEVLGRILQGGDSKAAEAGMAILGGHSVRDEEIKYGLAVTGTVDPSALLTNAGAEPGDVLFLTKPLGTGVLTTALKQGRVSAGEIADAVDGMKRLNRAAAAAARAAGAHALTDVTGFGLAGHAWQMAEASGVAFRIEWERLPLYAGAMELASEGVDSGGGRANAAYYGSRARLARRLPAEA